MSVGPRELRLAHCAVELTDGTVVGASGASRLSESELSVLRLLAAEPGAVVPRDRLVEAAGGAALDGVLHRLRAKVERDPAHPAVLLTEHGDGARLVVEPALVWLDDGVADIEGRWVERNGSRQDLTAKEAALLGYLAARPGRIVTGSELLVHVWHVRSLRTPTLKTTLWRLRGKVEIDPARPRHLQTVRGGGFRFVPPGSTSAVPIRLPAAGRAALDALCALPGPFDAELAAAALALDEVQARTLLVELLAVGALETDAEGRIRPRIGASALRPGPGALDVARRHDAWVLGKVRAGVRVRAVDLEAALQRARAEGESLVAMELLTPLREELWGTRDHARILEVATALLGEIADPLARARLYWVRAGSRAWYGDWPAAMAEVEAGLEAARAAPASGILVTLLVDGAGIAGALGDDPRARDMLADAAARVDLGDPLLAARISEARSRDALSHGERGEARDLALAGLMGLEAAIRLGRLRADDERCSHRRRELLTALGLAHRELGEAGIACANFREASGIVSRTNGADHLRWARLHWAGAMADLGRHADAEARFAELLAELEGHPSDEDRVLVLFDRGVARGMSGRLEDARTDLIRARTLASGAHQVVRGQLALALAAVLARLGEPIRAEALIAEGSALLPERERAYLGLGDVASGCAALQRGDLAGARRHLERARDQTMRPFWRVLADGFPSDADAENS